jgi:hypothetical protein
MLRYTGMIRPGDRGAADEANKKNEPAQVPMLRRWI